MLRYVILRMNFLKLTTLFLFLVTLSFGQEPQVEKYDPNTATLKEQYDYLYKKSGNYQVYKVIERVKINAYWKNVEDSLKMLHTDMASRTSTIAEQKSKIASLESSLEEVNLNNTALTEEKDSISFFGANWEKGKYKTLMWSLVLGLVALVAFAFMRFVNSNRITKNTKKRVNELESEFETYKKTAISREQEIKRELQNYINKLSDITGA